MNRRTDHGWNDLVDLDAAHGIATYYSVERNPYEVGEGNMAEQFTVLAQAYLSLYEAYRQSQKKGDIKPCS